METMMSNSQIRWLIRRDMPEVLNVLEASFFEHDEDGLLSFLRSRNNIGMVCEDKNNELVGVMIYTINRKSIELADLTVDYLRQKKGFGFSMINSLKSKLNPNRKTKLVTKRSERDLEGQTFLRRQGFSCNEIIKDFYEPEEDAYVFEYYAT